MHYTTPVPNEVFDMYLRELKPGELKVLLVVVRQTLGFVVGHNNEFRRQRVWLTRKRICKLAGLSEKATSASIKGLLAHNLIAIHNEYGEPVLGSYARSQAFKLYFSLTIRPHQNCGKIVEKGNGAVYIM